MRYAEAYEKLPDGSSPTREALDYLAMLAGQTGKDVNALDLPEEIPTDRNEINKLLFLNTEAKTIDPPEISNDQLKRLNQDSKRVASRQADAAYDEFTEFKADAERYGRDAEASVDRARIAYAKYLAFTSGPADIYLVDQIRDIHTKTNFEFVCYYPSGNDSHILFTTRSPYTISYSNPAAGIDVTAHFGRMQIKILPFRSRILVLPYENNKVVDGYLHPHIGSSGRPCWGNVSGLATEYMSKANYYQACLLLDQLLKNYDPAAPHMAIEYFSDNFNPGDQPMECYIYGECSECGHEINTGTFVIATNSFNQFNARRNLQDVENEEHRRLIERLICDEYGTMEAAERGECGCEAEALFYSISGEPV